VTQGNVEEVKFDNVCLLTQRRAELQHFSPAPLCVSSHWRHPSAVSLDRRT